MKLCVICGKINKTKGKTCSKPCSKIKKEQTMLERYGVKNPSQFKQFQEKRLQTFRERFGCENPFQHYLPRYEITEILVLNTILTLISP